MRDGRKPVSRAESQQRTREEVLDAAEELFLEHGLHGTTVAKIAAAAGRTQGAIYSNFASKENLCAEVLLRCAMRIFAGLVATMAESSGRLDEKLDLIAEGWKQLAADQSLVALAAEYALAIRKDPDQLAISHGHIDMGRSMIGIALAGALPFQVPDERRDEAVHAIIATGLGLALGHTLGVVDEEQSAAMLMRTVRMWVADLELDTDSGD
ncbi:TetR/AcrR family transcriptional regulator [Nocardia huaxiensis]|uniref:TetR/AcrR family transcriptional regulator n=1 Tax=Nocardia huaxiensis TaxID=2755382 RepID=A0A7D6V8C1_9NOCA|nr:TetR/AcrR family transcriptional regulator [Nocardia huaxiensis]QLY29214.1 TetR/AcrR family transcriptional regulator [Nocardia huaxiensis]UFS97285.1 TetR/AcrR family transcriptional regulator [Nocardia huaxiensis]